MRHTPIGCVVLAACLLAAPATGDAQTVAPVQTSANTAALKTVEIAFTSHDGHAVAEANSGPRVA